MRIAYSYLRYSSPGQGDGDSVRRQTQAAANWCKRHPDVRLDTTRTYLDRGRSAYHGRHRQEGGALKAFLDDVKAGYIPRGSVLIVENLDRLSREPLWKSIEVISSIVNAGIEIVALLPHEIVVTQDGGLGDFMRAAADMDRGHNESAIKASRMAEVWGERRRRMREEGAILTRMLPAWIEERDGKLVPVPERAHVVRRLFELARGGYGLGLIVRELTRDGVPSWGAGSKGWTKRYVHKILKGRAVLGEFQPTTSGKPDGDPIPDYFPAVVDESTFLKVEAALERRKHRPGPIGVKAAALFSGLLRDASTGGKIVVGKQGRTGYRILRPARSMEGSAPCVSFPADTFEVAVLSLLKEVDPRTVLGEDKPNESELVAAKLAVKEQQARQIDALLDEDGADCPTLARRVQKLDKECSELKRQLAELRQQEANPRSVAWAEAQSLLDVATTEHHRLRLRELLRTIVEEIRVLIVPRASHRLCAMQVFFRGGGRRDYLVWYQAKARCRPGGWVARSLPADIAPGDLDLRRGADAVALRQLLFEIDIKLLADAMRADRR
jgi:DNA invertase Pin-like site-specific DNA recombinase